MRYFFSQLRKDWLYFVIVAALWLLVMLSFAQCSRVPSPFGP